MQKIRKIDKIIIYDISLWESEVVIKNLKGMKSRINLTPISTNSLLSIFPIQISATLFSLHPTFCNNWTIACTHWLSSILQTRRRGVLIVIVTAFPCVVFIIRTFQEGASNGSYIKIWCLYLYIIVLLYMCIYHILQFMSWCPHSPIDWLFNFCILSFCCWAVTISKFVKRNMFCYDYLVCWTPFIFQDIFVLLNRENIGHLLTFFQLPCNLFVRLVNHPVPSYCKLYDYYVNQEDLIK